MKKPILLFIALLFLVVSADANYYGVIARKNACTPCSGNYGVTTTSTGNQGFTTTRTTINKITLDCCATSGEICATLSYADNSDREVFWSIYDGDAASDEPLTQLWVATPGAGVTYDAAWTEAYAERCTSFSGLNLEVGQVLWIGYLAEGGSTRTEYDSTGGTQRYYNSANPTPWPNATDTHDGKEFEVYLKF